MVRGKGTGFIAHPDHEEDIIISTNNLGFALDGDTVLIEVQKQIPGKRLEGKVIEVLTTHHTEFVGTLFKKNNTYTFQPDNKRIHIRPQIPEATKTHEGMKVVITLHEWRDKNLPPTAEIIEVLGPVGDHETEMQAIIRSGEISVEFPKIVQDAAQALYENSSGIFKDAENDPKRRDMRDAPTCTIDPHDAKDFDDAISIKKIDENSFEIGIHIADVSHYVTENEDIDLEARERGTSTYLVDRVIPMLPEILSNDLCSLRPNEDRLAFSAVFIMDTNGNITDEWYGQTFIHSNVRFSYEDAQQVLDDGNGEMHSELSTLMNIARILRKRRYKNGAIAFEQPEVKFELDSTGKPIRVYTKVRTETMLMIEDYMLLANRKVSEYVKKISKRNNHSEAFIYRIHDKPDPDRIEMLATFLHAMGYEFKTDAGTVTAQTINNLLQEIGDKPEADLIKTATIRTMAKAIYSTKNIGHFGLAFENYTHFTSPIRRYPDLMAHRMLRRHLDKSRISSKELSQYEKLATQSSDREAVAVRAERDSIKFKQVEYMLDKVGQEFDGIVNGVSDWGIYVLEKESRAEGMVRLSSIKSDYFTHDASKYRIKGDRKGATYSLGDIVRIKLTKADIEEKMLDFELVVNKK